MTREDVLNYVRDTYGTEADYPWHDDNAVLRHDNNKKWYGLLMRVARNRLGLTGEEQEEILNVKCDPLLAGSLRERPCFLPAYHMNKEQWLTVVLRTAPEEDVHMLLDLSWQMTAVKLRSKKENKA